MASLKLPKSLGPAALSVIRTSENALRQLKKVDPRERYVLLFPSEELAYPKMGLKLMTSKSAEQIYEDASNILKKDILKLCVDGSISDLHDSIENRCLATFVTSHATIAKMRTEKPGIITISKTAGGFGIGFINTLVFSGAMTFENALDLVQRQGRAMDRAAKIVPSARVKLRLMPATSKLRVCLAAEDHCRRIGIPRDIAVCSVSKLLHPHVLEISGHEEAIKYLETEGLRIFKFRYISRARKITQATYTRLMRPVSDFMRGYINHNVEQDKDYLRDPETCSIYPSTAAYRLRISRSIKEHLIESPVMPDQTEQLLHRLYARPSQVPQPNTYVLWSKELLHQLSMVNVPAWRQAKVYR